MGKDFAPGSVLADMITIVPGTVRSIAQGLAMTGVDMLDVPVSDGEQDVAATLALMAGGKASVFDPVRPLFAALARD